MANALLAPTEARIVAANQHGQQQMRDCEFDQDALGRRFYTMTALSCGVNVCSAS
jgi:hypothetical protein